MSYSVIDGLVADMADNVDKHTDNTDTLHMIHPISFFHPVAEILVTYESSVCMTDTIRIFWKL